jgi:hypothetical protein
MTTLDGAFAIVNRAPAVAESRGTLAVMRRAAVRFKA